MKTESSETEMEQELSDFVLPQFDETPVQTGQVQFRDLESLSGAINKGGQEQFFEVRLNAQIFFYLGILDRKNFQISVKFWIPLT